MSNFLKFLRVNIFEFRNLIKYIIKMHVFIKFSNIWIHSETLESFFFFKFFSTSMSNAIRLIIKIIRYLLRSRNAESRGKYRFAPIPNVHRGRRRATRPEESGSINRGALVRAIYLPRFSPRPSSAPNSVPSPGRPRPTQSSWHYGRCTRRDSHRRSPVASLSPR